MTKPVVLLDRDDGGAAVFAAPKSVISAETPAEVVPALAAIAAAQAAGNYVAGYFSYELGYALEPRLRALLPAKRAVPLLWFGVFGPPEDGNPAELTSGRAYAGPLRPEWDEAAYETRFARVKAGIAAGDFYQANLTFRARFAFAGDPLALYARLKAAAGVRHGGYVDDGARAVLSLSPELFFEIGKDGAIATKPMKGTAARGADASSDAAAREGLARDAKNRAENLMIVDLLRNDLGRIAELGSVAVPELFAVESYPTVHQMVSTVTARLRPGIGVEAVVRALFPCGSVTGAPKIKAMEDLAVLESSPRGIYCGAIGCFAPDGSARFNVAIRTLTITGGEGELGIGGGIVADSVGTDEYGEALLKARFYTQHRRPMELIETLRWDGEFVRLGRHLARMEQSAAVFGIGFDHGKAMAALYDALPRREGAVKEKLRVRLTLNEAGEFACISAPLGMTSDVWRFMLSPQRLNSADALARHKISWREAYEAPLPPGCDEWLFCNERGEVVEGARSNVFVERDGVLLTPPLSSGCLYGVLRQELLEEGRAVEAALTPDDLSGAVYLGNSLRGLMKAKPI